MGVGLGKSGEWKSGKVEGGGDRDTRRGIAHAYAWLHRAAAYAEAPGANSLRRFECLLETGVGWRRGCVCVPISGMADEARGVVVQ